MLRRVLAVAAGFVLFNVIVIAAEFVAAQLYAMPSNSGDTAELKAAIAAMPIGPLVVVLAGWAIASFAGGCVTARIARARGPALVLGVAAMVVGIINNIAVPPPLWFWVLTFVVFVPPAWAAARVAVPLSPA